MKTKIENLRELEYYADFIAGSTLTQDWIKEKPKNEKLQLLAKSWIGCCFYVNYMEQELRLYKKVTSEYREDKNKALIENRKLKSKLNKLQKELNNLKKITQL